MSEILRQIGALGYSFKKGPHLYPHECFSDIMIVTRAFGSFQSVNKYKIFMEYVLYVQNIDINIR
jgi:hypothetical protein